MDQTPRNPVAKLNTLPIMVARGTFTTIHYMTRVPCVGEFIFIGNNPNDPQGPLSRTHWRIVSVQHMPPVDGISGEAVAEVHVVRVKDADLWNGQFPGNGPEQGGREDGDED